MDFTYDIFYYRWRSCTISYTFGTLPDRIGAYRYISAITSCDRLVDHINSMPQYCCVPGCTNSGGHVFPSDPELKKKWRVANIAWIKAFPLILMYFPIDYNCFVNQLYHKTKIICKKRITCKKKQGDFNFALQSREGDFRRYRESISSTSSGLVSSAIVVLINCLSTLTDAISRQQKQFTDNG
jgi:hypothetical protein